jgi:hypothetical protein
MSRRYGLSLFRVDKLLQLRVLRLDLLQDGNVGFGVGVLQWGGRRFQIPPQEIGAVRVRPGDILFGDIDGVLVVPREAEEEVFTSAHLFVGEVQFKPSVRIFSLDLRSRGT